MAFLEQKRVVDLLDADAAVLHRLDGMRQLQRALGGFFRIVVWTVFDVLHELHLLCRGPAPSCEILPASAISASFLFKQPGKRRFFLAVAQIAETMRLLANLPGERATEEGINLKADRRRS
jgi:hypothetical protein